MNSRPGSQQPAKVSATSGRQLFKIRMDRASLPTFGFIDALSAMDLEAATSPSPGEARLRADRRSPLLDQAAALA